jgi:choline kinase
MKKRTFYSDLANKPVRSAGPLDSTPKCLVTVNEISILERLVSSLQDHNYNRLVIVMKV